MAMATIVQELMAQDSAKIREFVATVPRVTLRERMTHAANTDSPSMTLSPVTIDVPTAILD
jgi:hypothetical protein